MLRRNTIQSYSDEDIQQGYEDDKEWERMHAQTYGVSDYFDHDRAGRREIREEFHRQEK